MLKLFSAAHFLIACRCCSTESSCIAQLGIANAEDISLPDWTEISGEQSVVFHNVSPAQDNSDSRISETFDITKFEEMNQFAWSPSGLDMTRIEAKLWAMDNLERFSSTDFRNFVSRFQLLVEFAISSSGLDMTKLEATGWALGNDERYEKIDLREYINRFHKLRDFAISSQGLGMTGLEAKQWALVQCDQEFDLM